MVELRAVESADVAVFYELQRDPEAVAMAAFTPRDRDDNAAHWERVLANDATVKRTILLDGAAVGHVMCFEEDGERHVGYWIAREHWGKGVAGAALAAFLEEVEHRPLHAIVAKHNVASRRVLEKCGFVVRTERLGAPDRAGRFVEEYLLELPA